MTDNQTLPDQPTWVQLYMARRQSPPPERTRPRGRPRRLVPREKKTAFRLTDSEFHELSTWQSRFSALLDRHVSYGETLGILARICTARLDNVNSEYSPESLATLVEMMIE